MIRPCLPHSNQSESSGFDPEFKDPYPFEEPARENALKITKIIDLKMLHSTHFLPKVSNRTD